MSLEVAMAVELATAYVSLVASTNDLVKSVDKGFSGLSSQLDKKGSAAGAGFIGGLTGGLVGPALQLGGKLVSAITAPLTKGMDRLVSLDNASAKLRGLGHDAESVGLVMSNALASVKGTAFGLDEAAGTAANAVAAGVKPGEDLGRYLGIIADTAAVAGVGLADVGSVMNNVTTVGAAYNDSLQILAQKGLPVYTWLAEQAGVSEAAIKDLASQGQISSEQLRSALESNVGGAALATGETFQGAVANMNASLGRIGANVLSPVFEQLAPTFAAITASMGPLEGVATSVGETFGEFLVPLLDSFQGLLAGGFDFVPFLELAGYLSPIGLAFKVLQPILPLVMDSFGQIATILGGALGQVLAVLVPILGELVLMLSEGLSVIIPVLLPILTSLAGIISSVLLAVLPLLEPLMTLITAIFPILQTVIAALIPIIQGVVDAISAILIPVVNMLVDILGGVIEFLTGIFTGNWEQAWNGIIQIFEGIWNGLGDIFMGVLNGVIDLINGFLGSLNEVGNFVSDVTGGAISFEVGKIPHLAEGATVMPRRGGTLAVLAEAGRAESVVDTGLLNRALEQGISGPGSGSSIQFDVHPAPGMDEEVIGRVAAERLNYALRG